MIQYVTPWHDTFIHYIPARVIIIINDIVHRNALSRLRKFRKPRPSNLFRKLRSGNVDFLDELRCTFALKVFELLIYVSMKTERPQDYLNKQNLFVTLICYQYDQQILCVGRNQWYLDNSSSSVSISNYKNSYTRVFNVFKIIFFNRSCLAFDSFVT